MSVMSPYSEGSFYAQESKGDLTRDHYLNSSPIEPSLKAGLTLQNNVFFYGKLTYELVS